MTKGWWRIQSEIFFHYYFGEKGSCGQWRAVCRTAEDTHVEGIALPVGELLCPHCVQVVDRLRRRGLLSDDHH
jgi:hypothetical protein